MSSSLFRYVELIFIDEHQKSVSTILFDASLQYDIQQVICNVLSERIRRFWE